MSLLAFSLVAPALAQTRQQRRGPARGQTRTQAPRPKPEDRRPAKSYKDIQYPPLGALRVPQPARVELPNGMVVFLLEDRALPVVNAQAYVRAGWRWEPVDKAGVAVITGAVRRTGGTRTRDGDQLDEELDRLGAVVETYVGEDSGGAFVSVLREDADRGLQILADILRNPRFPDDKIELAKINERDTIARRNDDPSGIAFREFNRVLYGPDSAYAHLAEYRTINRIERDDLQEFHKRFFQPENVILGVWGDFDAADMRARIERAFGSWPRGGRPKPVVPEVDPAARARRGVYFINRDDVNQSWVLVGGLGGKRNDPDFYALNVMSYILGGGFSSRLFSKIRSQEGLAYAVWADWAAGWDRPGSFMAAGGTKTETTVKMLDSIKRELSTMAASGVTEEEVNRAKDAILKGFAFEFDSTGKVVRRIMSYEYYGYPADYLQRFADNIKKVTAADVQRVARENLREDRLFVLVLGKGKDFDRPLSTLGQVTTIDVTIPPEK
ncbi:MAG TPA: pitrilysin family protein [Pyrinomonadaceae bacterium]|nr:pitrilysin family protein [Pyrinomonadaceae bacterium]